VEDEGVFAPIPEDLSDDPGTGALSINPLILLREE
jgi:hypothetical protein